MIYVSILAGLLLLAPLSLSGRSIVRCSLADVGTHSALHGAERTYTTPSHSAPLTLDFRSYVVHTKHITYQCAACLSFKVEKEKYVP